jgi:hypothetical protein
MWELGIINISEKKIPEDAAGGFPRAFQMVC